MIVSSNKSLKIDFGDAPWLNNYHVIPVQRRILNAIYIMDSHIIQYVCKLLCLYFEVDFSCCLNLMHVFIV